MSGSASQARRPGRGMASEEILGKAYDAKLMARVWQFVRPHWKMLLVAFALMPIAVGFELAQPYVLKIAIDEYIAAGRIDGLGLISLVFVALVILQSLASYAQLYALNLLGQRSMRDLRVRTYNHVLSQRAGFFDRMPVGRLLTRMTSDVESINEMFAAGVVTLAADVIKLIAIVVMMLVLNVELALITFCTIPILAAVVEYARRGMRASFRTIRVKLAAMNAYLAEHLGGMKVVQLFTREARVLRTFNQINRDHRDAYLGAIKADVSLYAMVEAVSVVAVAALAWYSTGRIGEGALTVGLVIAFIEYINKFFIPVRDLSAKYTVMQSAMAATERIMTLLDVDEPDAPVRGAAPQPRPAHIDGDGTRPAIEFDNVRFGYRDDEEILHGVSFQVEPGETVAVVGPTGSGKSTIIRLLTRLYEPQHGTICVDGHDIRQLPASDVRKRVAVVSQDVFLFSGTIADNVRLGASDASDAQVNAALGAVGADRVLDRRDAGADEAVAESGSNFSAGERQLVAFARAMVRDPDVLVLDEATAHVDPEAEAIIEDGLQALMQGRTSLVIAHRLSTVRRADRILVIVRGRLVEQGTHDELLAEGGVYAQLEGTLAR